MNPHDLENAQSIRLDIWLWYARFFKSRSLATKLCTSGRVRVNDVLVSKAHRHVHIGDVLTFPQGPRIRVIKVQAIGTRRGPAPEAQGLYQDLEPDPGPRGDKPLRLRDGARDPGAGRPTKADRRALDRLKEFPDD